MSLSNEVATNLKMKSRRDILSDDARKDGKCNIAPTYISRITAADSDRFAFLISGTQI